jgi:NAD-dependent deacetylase
VAPGLSRLAELVRGARRVVALTGAGISVPSGIPDFRSPGTGLWANVDPMEVAHIDAWRADPERFWHFYGHRFHALEGKEPNPAHEALVELERRGHLHAVVTQNIDMLHSRAGSEEVVEVHGSIRSAQCLRCLWTEPAAAVLAQLAETPVPACPQCGEPLKPGIVLFGEVLPAGAMERAVQLARGARLMLVVGSSLEVWPVGGLPLEARSLVIVNRGPTALDDRALLKIDAGAGETLAAVLASVQ